MADVREAGDEVLRRVEDATGKPVLVTADPTLSVLATVRPAGVSAPVHLLRYKPVG